MADLGLGVAPVTGGIAQLRTRRADIAAQHEGILKQLVQLQERERLSAAALVELDFALSVLQDAAAEPSPEKEPRRRNVRHEVLAAIQAAGPQGVSTTALMSRLEVRQKAVDAATTYHAAKERIYYDPARSIWRMTEYRPAVATAEAADD